MECKVPVWFLLPWTAFFILAIYSCQFNINLGVFALDLRGMFLSEILTEIALTAFISFASRAILTIFVLPIQDQEISFHFLMSSFILFDRVMQFVLQRSFTSLVRLIFKYLAFLALVVNSIVSLISFLVDLYFIQKFYSVQCVLYFVTLALYLPDFLVEFFEFSM